MRCYFLIGLILVFFTNSLFSQPLLDSTVINKQAIKLVDSLANDNSFVFYNTNHGAKIYNLQAKGSSGYIPQFQFIKSKKNIYPLLDNFQKYTTLKRLRPFTNVSFITGFSREEQIFNLFHYQNFSKRFSAGLEYKRVYFQGIYHRQKFENANFKTIINYSSINGFYKAQLVYRYLSSNQFQQGGLSDINEFINNTITNRLAYTVLLKNSESNAIRNGLEIKNQFKLLENKLKFNYDIKIDGWLDTYFDGDPKSTLYNVTRYSSTSFKTKKEEVSLINNASFTYKIGETKASLFIKSNVQRYNQTYSFRDLDYIKTFSLGGKFAYNLTNNLRLKLKAKYSLFGYQQGDYNFKIQLNHKFSNDSRLSLATDLKSTRQDLFYQNYLGNHFSWNNLYPNSFEGYFSSDLKKEKFLSVALTYEVSKIKLFFLLSYQQFQDFTYFNDNIVLSQLDRADVYGLHVKKPIALGDFHFDTSFNLQKSTKDRIIPLPIFSIEQYAYFQRPILKRTLPLKLGIRVVYNTSFYGYNYMPALNSFYTQSKEQLGNYPYVDIFVSTKVRRAIIFVKYEHINSLLGNYNYLLTPKQPFIDGIVSFGISWNMLD